MLKFPLLPIRDWNLKASEAKYKVFPLKFPLLPIRDWNYYWMYLQE